MADQDCTASQDNCHNSKTPVVDSRFKRPQWYVHHTGKKKEFHFASWYALIR